MYFNQGNRRKRGALMRTLLLSTVCGSAMGNGAQAQDADEATEEAQVYDSIIVTGTTSRNRTKLESSIAVTVAEADVIDKKAGIGIADTLELVPGLWVEDSGGEVSNNVAPRGLGGGQAFRFVALLEDGLPVHYDGEIVDHLVRSDITTDRFEAIRGGTAGILTVNGPGAAINFITKKGTEDPEGAIRLTYSDYNTVKTEGYYSGPLNDDWTFMVGGFFRSGDSVRDTGFTADHGGQIRANLTRKTGDSELTFRFKAVDDRNAFLLPIPLQNPDSPTGIPGVDANFGTLLSLDNSRTINKTPGGDIETNLRNGFNTSATVFGVEYEKDFGNGLIFRNNGSYTSSTLTVNAMFNGGNSSLQLGSERLAQQDVTDLVSTFAGDGAVRAALAYADTGEVIASPDTINGNGLVTVLIPEWRERSLNQIVNDTRLTWETDRNSFTAGLLFANINLERDTAIDSDILSEVTDNPRRLDIVALDSADNVVGQLTDGGVLTHGSWYTDNSGDVQSYSFYANNEFQATDDLRIDAGLRYEIADYNHVRQLRSGGQALNRGPNNILADDTIGQFGTGNFATTENEIEELAFTAGFNYKFTDNIAMYGRYSDTFQTPTLNFDADAILVGASELEFYEVGLRYLSPLFSGTATVFSTEFRDLPFSATNRDTGEIESINISTEAVGLEWDFVLSPTDYFRVDAGGVFQDTQITGIPGDADENILNGNQVTRTPDIQARITPTVTYGDAEIYLTYHYLDSRFADLGNTLELPSYSTVDLGVIYDISDSLRLQVTGRNITNEVGLTEGNPRSGFSEIITENAFFARPILGRSIIGSLTLSF